MSPLVIRLAALLGVPATAALDESLTRLFATARSRWPDLNVDVGSVVDHIAEVVREEADRAKAIASLHADVVFVAAVLDEDATALASLSRLIDESAARAAMADAPADEIALEARQQLLTPDDDGRSAKLARYSAKGSLQGWLNVLVTRIGLGMQRRARRGGQRRVSDEALLAMPSVQASPELAALRARYEAPFREALRDALSQLSPEDRNLLRFHIVDGLGLDRLAPLLGVHRATAARRLARTKELLFTTTRELMHARVGLAEDEFRSVMGLLLSRVEIETSLLAAAKK